MKKITGALLALILALTLCTPALAATLPYQGVRISNASGDETFSDWGGQAGDQTGAEWRVIPW